MLIRIHSSHLTCKVANKRFNVRERKELVERNEDGPFPLPVFLWIVIAYERNFFFTLSNAFIQITRSALSLNSK